MEIAEREPEPDETATLTQAEFALLDHLSDQYMKLLDAFNIKETEDGGWEYDISKQ